MHLFLRIRVSDLHMPGRGVCGETLRGRSHTVDTVFSHTAATHNDQVTGRCRFLLSSLTFYHGGHNANGCNKDQTLSKVALVKPDLAVRRWNAAFVAAVPHPFNYTVK